MEKESMQNITEINLKSLFRILAKRKAVFLITSAVIFIIGLTFTFLFSPEYSSDLQITLSDNEIFYNDALYKYFPNEANDLWIIPNTKESYQRVDYIIAKIEPINSQLKSEAIVNNALNALQGKITKTQLIRSLNVSIDRWNCLVTIENYARCPELVYNINKSMLDSYVLQKKNELENAYNALLGKLDPEIELSKKEIASLESEIEKEAIDFGVEWYGRLDELNLNKIKIEFVNPELGNKLDAAMEKYDILNTTRQNMVNNKELFIDRIKVVEPPELSDVKNTSSYLRNILFSLIAALVIGIITAFTVNYFKNPKN
jgi:capsular polysaccharide biosynthesis protein